MNRVINYLKNYIGVTSIVLAVCILLTYSLSYFMTNSDNHRAAEMYLGELQYSITIDGSNTNVVTASEGETIVELTLNGLSDIKTYYKLLYTYSGTGITVTYFDKTQDTSGNLSTYDSSKGSLIVKGTKTLKLKINNTSTASRVVTFKVSGGYSTNTLNDVIVPSGYREINLATQNTNTYFCHTSSTLTDGLEYTNSGLTYKYKWQVNPNSSAGWGVMSEDGWGVKLTDTKSTEPVTSKLCTYINNKPILSLAYTFSYSKSTSLDLDEFDTHNVKYMQGTFYNSEATTINVSNLNTSKVTDMNSMFKISNAVSLDLSSFNTSNVTDMSGMFYYSLATTIDVINFDTSKVTNMESMFYRSQATTLDLSNFDTSNVTNMYSMFYESKATTLDVSNFDTRNVTNMSRMFYYSQATTLDVSNFDTSKVTDMSWMFIRSKATTLDVSNFDTSNVTDMNWMFYFSQATTIDVSNFDTSKVTNMSRMFAYSQATTLDVSNFDTSNVTNMGDMFQYSQATVLDVSNFNTSKVTDMSWMFYESKATTLDVSNFNTSNVTTMFGMFQSTQMETLDLSSFDTSKVTNMAQMFDDCNNLKTIYASDKFVTTNVTIDNAMFSKSPNLVGGSGTKYDRNYIDKTYARIDTLSTPGYFTRK